MLMRFCIFGCLFFTLLSPGCSDSGTQVHSVHYTEPFLDSCNAERDHLYTVSMPDQIPPAQRLPLILLIDPHGDGKLAVGKYTEALTDIPAVIAGSEKIRNNDPDFISSLSHLLEDVLAKYPSDPDQVIVAGFSGGARMTYYYGANHNILGIIMYGAGPGRSSGISGLNKMYLVSGTRDFNFMEQYLPPFQGLYDPQHYLPDFFRGSHEWPPSDRIYESVAYILKDEPDFPEYIQEQLSQQMLVAYDSLWESNELFFAAKSLEKAWVFAPDPKRRKLSGQIDAFKDRPEWIRYIRSFEGILQQELGLRQTYLDKLADPDTSWWKREIQGLDRRIRSASDPGNEDVLYRLKGFIGIILYSQINSFIQSGQYSSELDRLMVIYEFAEPESEDLARFKQQVQQLPGTKSPGQ